VKAAIKKFIAGISGKWIFDQIMLGYKDKYVAVPKVGNYIRIKALELAVNEIQESAVQGDIAEVGVFRGDFAAYLNRAFPDRKLYLFDTFAGFDKRDVVVEQKADYSSGDQDFSGTSTELVLAKMKNREVCIVKQGYFPDSLQGLEGSFAFVSLDADLFLPIYEGLCYFYPRLNSGGVIFIHDYNNQNYPGAKDAVRKYCKENKVAFVPIPDTWGTAVIRKP
jgi:O-methyltransferase